ncbi:hypothetical protein V8C26DRAFT_403549 [Trichoderma gracile]
MSFSPLSSAHLGETQREKRSSLYVIQYMYSGSCMQMHFKLTGPSASDPHRETIDGYNLQPNECFSQRGVLQCISPLSMPSRLASAAGGLGAAQEVRCYLVPSTRCCPIARAVILVGCMYSVRSCGDRPLPGLLPASWAFQSPCLHESSSIWVRLAVTFTRDSVMLPCRSKIVSGQRGLANKRHTISSTTRKLDRFSFFFFFPSFFLPLLLISFVFCNTELLTPVDVLIQTLDHILNEEGQTRSICSLKWKGGKPAGLLRPYGAKGAAHAVFQSAQSQSALLAPSP